MRTGKAGWHYQFCLDIVLLSRGSRSALLQTSVGLSFIVVLSSVYPPAFKGVADPVGEEQRRQEDRHTSFLIFSTSYFLRVFLG